MEQRHLEGKSVGCLGLDMADLLKCDKLDETSGKLVSFGDFAEMIISTYRIIELGRHREAPSTAKICDFF